MEALITPECDRIGGRRSDGDGDGDEDGDGDRDGDWDGLKIRSVTEWVSEEPPRTAFAGVECRMSVSGKRSQRNWLTEADLQCHLIGEKRRRAEKRSPSGVKQAVNWQRHKVPMVLCFFAGDLRVRVLLWWKCHWSIFYSPSAAGSTFGAVAIGAFAAPELAFLWVLLATEHTYRVESRE